jgi:hypothetical protein
VPCTRFFFSFFLSRCKVLLHICRLLKQCAEVCNNVWLAIFARREVALIIERHIWACMLRFIAHRRNVQTAKCRFLSVIGGGGRPEPEVLCSDSALLQFSGQYMALNGGRNIGSYIKVIRPEARYLLQFNFSCVSNLSTLEHWAIHLKRLYIHFCPFCVSNPFFLFRCAILLWVHLTAISLLCCRQIHLLQWSLIGEDAIWIHFTTRWS